MTRTMDRTGPVDPSHPVCHVSWYEAEAFARFAGKRLPTEIEWEAAASWDPAAGRKRRFPWGDDPATRQLANVDQLGFGTAPVGAYPRNVSPIGCYGMIGDVWEWTASDFRPGPGSRRFPTGNIPKSSSVTSTRFSAGARGPPGPVRCATPSATGTTPSAARSSAASGAPVTRRLLARETVADPRMLAEVAEGLSSPQKELSPKYFYDQRGSELFEEITRLEEYYPTRTERGLLESWMPSLIRRLGTRVADRARRRQRGEDPGDPRRDASRRDRGAVRARST